LSAINDEAGRENQRRAQMHVETQSWKVVGRVHSLRLDYPLYTGGTNGSCGPMHAKSAALRLARRSVIIIGNHEYGRLFRNTELHDSRVYRAEDLAHSSSIPFAPVDQPKK
jgi:hypothetical protein